MVKALEPRAKLGPIPPDRAHRRVDFVVCFGMFLQDGVRLSASRVVGKRRRLSQ